MNSYSLPTPAIISTHLSFGGDDHEGDRYRCDHDADDDVVGQGLPKTKVPTRMAVIGSNTPKTDALVAPMLRVAMASVAVETMVGKMASPTKLSQSSLLSMPAVST